MTTRISIPTTWNTSEHCNKLFEIWEQVSELSSTNNPNIELDFHHCNFLSHNGVAFLGGLAHFIKFRGGQVVFDWSTLNVNIRNNLAQNGFLYHFGENQQPWGGNSIPYRRDCNQDTPAIMEYLLSKWLDMRWVNVSSQLQDLIAGKVSEIYNNAFEHSQSEIGIFSCGQHYPNKKCLELAVIDFGIGIPSKVRALPENSHFSSNEALEWALQSGTSTVPSMCRGLGLNLLQEFINCNQGILKIFSNDVYVKIADNKVIYKKQKVNFSGTLVNITLKCSEAHYCLTSELSETGSIRF